MRPAQLEGGQPLAMVHPSAQETDELFIVHGCSVPVVLRKNLDIDDGRRGYIVIGSAYTLGTDQNSTYYHETKNTEDLLDWGNQETEELNLY